MPVSKQKKEDILQKLVEKFGRSKSVVFADYRGLDVAGISDLRSQLRAENAEMQVAKRTLIKLAAKDLVGEVDDSAMEGPVFATFSYEDALSGIRVLFKFSKTNANLKLLGGIIDGKVVGPEVIQQYAELPSYDQLLAKLIGSMNAPISGFVGIGNSLVSGIVRVLNAYKNTKPAEVPAAVVKEEEVSPVVSSASEPEVTTDEAPTITVDEVVVDESEKGEATSISEAV